MSSQFGQGRVATPGSLAFFVVASVVSFNGNSFPLDITCVCSSLVVRVLLWIRKREDISWADFAQEKAWASFRGCINTGGAASADPAAVVVVAAIRHLDGKLETSLLHGWFPLALFRTVRARWRARRARSMLYADSPLRTLSDSGGRAGES